jgi:two-component system sensor histidine kinase BaeS
VVRATSSPSADRAGGVHAPIRPPVPRSFQTRLTVAFLGIVALTLLLVAPVVINRLDDYFRDQEVQSLRARAAATANLLGEFIESSVGGQAVLAVSADGETQLNPVVQTLLVDRGLLTALANNVAEADVRVVFGPVGRGVDNAPVVVPSPGLTFTAALGLTPEPPRARDTEIAIEPRGYAIGDWGIELTLSNPFTSRASTIRAITGLLLIMAAIAFVVAVVVAALTARRFTTPLTRLTEASRRLAEGDLSSRVHADDATASTLEIQELSRQFDAMADRLEESVAIIRRDRDRSRDFLADVSHELRTPIAAIRTFNELLQGPAGADPAARTEFLESSAVQLDRLDWLAQNLLELSKLDSGLVLLDLRPDDLRATIESAVEQAEATAERRGITVQVDLPDRPLRILHDPPRIGQVVANLVGNALKFTQRGGSVHVAARAQADGGARIDVVDTGVGIDATELPHIFERFYRGSSANEARGSGSGLGLAIVKSIVDMHRGAIEVESRIGHGSRFVIRLPRDPREADERSSMAPPPPATPPDGTPSPAAPPPAGSPSAPTFEEKVVDSSSSGSSPLNTGAAS